NADAGAVGGFRQAADQLAGVDRASSYFGHDPKAARVGPVDRRIRQRILAADFPGAVEKQVAIDFHLAHNFREAGQNIPESREVAAGRRGERHTAGPAAGSGSDCGGFEQNHAAIGIETTQPGGCRKAGEASAYDSEIDLIRDGGGSGPKGDFPGRAAPAGRLPGWKRRRHRKLQGYSTAMGLPNARKANSNAVACTRRGYGAPSAEI